MPYPELTVIGVDPGVTTGWAKVVVPRACFYGDAESEIIEWDCGDLTGPLEQQVFALGRMARAAQGLSYKVGPAIVPERFDVMAHNVTTDPVLLTPARFIAMLQYAAFRGELGDARVTPQSRADAKHVFTDDRLKDRGLYVPGPDHIRDAIRQALLALRRAKENITFRDEIWAAAA